MNFTTVQAQLNDLPPTFKRPNAPFLQLIDSFSAGLYRFTQGADGTVEQVREFMNAMYGWLDVWGLLVGIPRYDNEPDAYYMLRIAFQVSAGAGPPKQIEKWIQIAWRITAVVSDLPTQVGYTITLPSTVTGAQITAIVTSLAYIRPAGVPFVVLVTGSGTYLETIDFFNAPLVQGAYLESAGTAVPPGIGPSTNNAVPLLPSLYLTDPTLNPA